MPKTSSKPSVLNFMNLTQAGQLGLLGFISMYYVSQKAFDDHKVENTAAFAQAAKVAENTATETKAFYLENATAHKGITEALTKISINTDKLTRIEQQLLDHEARIRTLEKEAKP